MHSTVSITFITILHVYGVRSVLVSNSDFLPTLKHDHRSPTYPSFLSTHFASVNPHLTMSNLISPFLHTLGLASFTNSFIYLFNHRKGGIAAGYGGHFQFLTNIALLLSTLTFVSALLHDFTSLVILDKSTRVLRFIATPLELVITLSYWSVHLLSHLLHSDGRLLSRREIPLTWDATFHLLPAVFLLLDYAIRPPRQGEVMDSSEAFAWFTLAIAVYYQWLEHCFWKNGVWPYPIFARTLGGAGGRGLVWMGVVLVMSGCREGVVGWSVRRI